MSCGGCAASAAAGFHSFGLQARGGSRSANSLALIRAQVTKIELGELRCGILGRSTHSCSPSRHDIAYSVPERSHSEVGCPIQGSLHRGGYEFDHPVTRTEEYLKAARQALRHETQFIEGKSHQRIRAADTSRSSRAVARQVYLVRLGPRCLNLVGAIAKMGPSCGIMAFGGRPTHHPGLSRALVGRCAEAEGGGPRA